MKAELEIECKNPELIIKSLKPDIDESSFMVKLKANKDKLLLNIESKDLSGLLAGINSYVRMIRALKDVEVI